MSSLQVAKQRRDKTEHGNEIKVIVRLRPLIERLSTNTNNSDCFVQMEGNNVILLPKDTHTAINQTSAKENKFFSVDEALWSFKAGHPNFADQETVYSTCGEEFLNHTLEGYNTCLFAYGQTGSGKSYTMFGDKGDGLIPRICANLFEMAGKLERENTSLDVSINYFEIYNEEVFDLLDNKTIMKKRMRENSQGPYVENLNEIEVKSILEVLQYLKEGTKKRKTASTKSNANSSRSHAVFTIRILQRHYISNQVVKEKNSHLRLVDLAGSERANNTGNTGLRLKEGSNINKSLTTLGRVLTILSENASSSNQQMVPYRDSALTWLLKESIGGNSKSCMICCISPTDYEETYSSLRYATLTKKIKNKAIVNNTSKQSQNFEELEQIQIQENMRLHQIIDDLKSQLNEKENNDLTKVNNLIKFNNKIQNEKYFKLKLELMQKEKLIKQLQLQTKNYYEKMIINNDETIQNLNHIYDNEWTSFQRDLSSVAGQIFEEIEFFKLMA